MSSLLLATAANVRAFQTLSSALDTSRIDTASSIDRDSLEDEMGRFRVWCGNLGALQKGHSSLEYRLRDSPLLSSNTLKFLGELEENLDEASAIVSGARLPYELQAKLEEEEEEEDDGFFSEDEDDDDEPAGSRTELSMRFAEIVDIIDNLYKLSVRIRTPTIRSRSLRAAAYNPKDVETGIEIMETYAEYDKMYVIELLASLRQPHSTGEPSEADFLVGRLSAAITLRRRQFKYWKRHRDKLGASTVLDDSVNLVQPTTERPQGPIRNDTLEVHVEEAPIVLSQDAGSQKTRKTLLSGTEATHHHQSLDEIIDTKSVTSFAVTVKDIHGRGVDLPPPPKAAHSERDFECPYCYIICPARYGRGRAWRTHLLQDLQPYVCTYADCESSEQLFRSRREWVEHEASHRKAWRCPEHLTAVYKTRNGLEEHLRSTHMDNFHESQLAAIAKVGETSTVDLRQKCPICHVHTDNEDVGDFQNHLANHLERIATFALPNNTEDDSDGASSAASQGWSGSTGSQDVSELSLPSNVTEELQQQAARKKDTGDDSTSPGLAEIREAGRPLLSAESLQQLPDISRNRLEMTASQLEPQDSLDDPQFEYASSASPQDEEEVDETPVEIQEHLEQREAFRTYLMSLYGAQSVRFYRRYGSWTGMTMFKDDNAASQAVRRFDTTRFPNIKVTQSTNPRNKLKFTASYPIKSQKSTLSRQSTADTQGGQDARSDSSTSVVYDTEEDPTKPPILTVSEIPTLRSLYRSRRILQRDQSYNPNDSYNQIISFCYHDLTRLKVDAIVNSANTSIKATRDTGTLNHVIFKAAGPALAKEAKTKGKIKPGQVELTHGFELPSSWVIHAARPRYSGATKGMGPFNVLTECYRSVLKMASMYELKSLAVPCLGTGGCGFPSRVAARIALQEVREYLDAHPDHGLERIIFCVKSATDEKAYIDFFPVFFPPTHGDLEVARSTEWSANRAALAAQVLETRTLVQKVFNVLSADFSILIQDFDEKVLSELGGIDSALATIRAFLLSPKELNRSLGDLNLICSVMQTVCESVTEITEQAKNTSGPPPQHKNIWDDYNANMVSIHGKNLASFLVDCRNFVQCLADILTLDGVELDEMSTMRQTLEAYKAKQVGQDAEGIRDHLDEVLYTREFQRERVAHGHEVVKQHQISSVSRLYQLGELETKPTLAFPSALFNHTVCLVREDITNLEVDIIVNSTDDTFAGMGTLDRTVFKKGGFELRQQVLKFVHSSEAVHVTPGYLLPAKHIFHVVPPNIFSKEAKDGLRKIYREVLHTAVLMRATSIAIPSIGTGMLNYPRRDCVSLAMEEVKRFLESAEPTSLLEKIVFVVFSSNDEFIYKSLLPTYFPPKEYGTEQLPATQPGSQPAEPTGDSSAADVSPPRRKFFGSLGDAFRSVRFGKQLEISREINTYEERAMIEFESHAKDCVICKDINRLYLEGRDLCEKGYPLAQMLLWSMNMAQDQTVQTKPDHNGQRTRLEVPTEIFPRSLTLLSTVEKSFRDENRSRPFVSQNRNYAAAAKDQEEGEELPQSFTIHRDEGTVPAPPQTSGGREKARAEVATYSALAKRWDPLISGDCSIHVYPGKIEVHESDFPSEEQVPLLSLQLTPISTVERYASNTELLVSGAPRLKSVLNSSGDVLFRNQNAAASEALLEILQRAMNQSEAAQERESYPEWNKRLHGIQEELALKEQREGRLSPLQGKLQSLTEATAKMMPSSPEPEEAKQSKLLTVPLLGPSISIQDSPGDQKYSALASQILEHLTTDLKTRPGSYIGQNIADIAMAIKQPLPEVSTATQELATARRVHNTMDENTWVVSNPPKELPSLRQEGTSIFKPNVTVSASSRTEDPMGILATQILSYMKFVNYAPRNKNGKTIRDIASALQIPTAEIWPAIRELAARGDIRRSVDVETWVVTSNPSEIIPDPQDADGASRKEEGEAEPTARTTQIRDTPIFAETPPSPTDPTLLSNPDLDLSSINIDDFVSYPSPFGARWTRIDKRLVDARVLTEAEEEFEETEDRLVVHRVLRREDVRQWAEKTREMKKWDENTREVRERQARRWSGGGGKDGRGEREGWRDGRGEKDRRQAKLDRVLAGDMKEDELRHFAEKEDEWRGE